MSEVDPFPYCSVLFEEKDDEHFTGLCLNGIAQAVRLTCLLNMVMLRNTFVSSLARFTMLHSPTAMRLKSAWAFRCVRPARLPSIEEHLGQDVC